MENHDSLLLLVNVAPYERVSLGEVALLTVEAAAREGEETLQPVDRRADDELRLLGAVQRMQAADQRSIAVDVDELQPRRVDRDVLPTTPDLINRCPQVRGAVRVEVAFEVQERRVAPVPDPDDQVSG